MDNGLRYISLSHLNDYDKIGLEELNLIDLSVREDTKFIFHEDSLVSVLNQLKPFYNILSINNEHLFKYHTTYYDTKEYLFYKQHQNGNKKRFKIRKRRYNSVSEVFFEIKIKNNKNKTIKERFIIEGSINDLSAEIKKLTLETIGISIGQLEPSLTVNYDRIALVDKNSKERITIDIGLNVKNVFGSKNFNKLIIAEVKQSRYNSSSKLIKILRKFKACETRFSKYCIGLSQTNKNLKYNRFKPQLLLLDKIINSK